MRLYAQWLDGAYFHLALSESKVTEQRLTELAIGVLKLHALLGTRIVLSDVQVIDSPIVLRLFTDSSFRDFLRKHPHFLELVAYPERVTKPTRYSIATSGLRRALAPKWISSTFPTPEATRELAQELLQAGDIDPERQLHDTRSPFGRVIKRWPERAALLEGMFRGVAHFATSLDAAVAPPIHETQPLTLYDMLRLTLDNPNVHSEHERYLMATIDFIESSIENPLERGLQSVVFTMLDQKLSSVHPHYRSIKHTAHHAWNAAVASSVNPEGGSLGYLSRSAQVGLYLDEPTDSLLPVSIREGRYSVTTFRKRVPLIIDWDPAKLSWSEVARVAGETAMSAKGFQKALLSNSESEMQSAINEHAKALAASLVSKPPPRVPGWMWILGPVIALIVNPELGTIITGVKAGEEALRDMLYRGRRYLVTNTLRKAAQLAKPRPRT